MTKREALKYFKTSVALANALGISKQSVSQWPLDEDIPEMRALKLKYEIIPNLERRKSA